MKSNSFKNPKNLLRSPLSFIIPHFKTRSLKYREVRGIDSRSTQVLMKEPRFTPSSAGWMLLMCDRRLLLLTPALKLPRQWAAGSVFLFLVFFVTLIALVDEIASVSSFLAHRPPPLHSPLILNHTSDVLTAEVSPACHSSFCDLREKCPGDKYSVTA